MFLLHKEIESIYYTKKQMAIPVLSFSGDAFSIGYQIGQHSATIMHRYLLQSPIWQELKKWKMSHRLEMLKKNAQQKFPLYFKEIEGISKGAELDFQDMFLWNCRGDLLENSPEGCTTYLTPGKQSTLIAHNEDGDPVFRDHAFIAEIKPDKGIGFTSFIYPCSLPGHAFAVTETGLVQTVNNLRLKNRGIGVPRQFLSRAILAAANLDEALDLFNRLDRSGGYHHILAQCGDSRLLSVEAPAERLSVQTITSPYGHANHLIHPELSDLPQTVTKSSLARQKRINELCLKPSQNSDRETIRRILGDKKNQALPIYREDPNDPDNENTLVTAVFEIMSDRIEWAVYESKKGIALFEKTVEK